MIERIGFGSSPAMSEWTASFKGAYEPGPHLEDYGQYIQQLRESSVSTLSNEKAIERIISLCVEGDPTQALDGLTKLDQRQLNQRQRAAYHRLMGALHRELGATLAARAAYTSALDCLGPDDSARIAIRWDLLALRDDEQALIDREQLIREPIVLTPAYEFTRKQSADEFAKELFEEESRPESTLRFRSGMPHELAWHNAALAIAYLTGDFEAASAARRAFGRFALGSSHERTDLQAVALQELQRAHDADALKAVLRKRGHVLHSSLDVNSVALTLRPVERSGQAAEPVWQSLLAVAGSLAPYLNDHARRSLAAEMVDAAVRHLNNQPDPFVAYQSVQGFRAPAAFIDALAAVGELTPLEIRRIIDALLARADRFVPWTGYFWRLVANYRWTPDDLSSAAKVAEAVAVLKDASEVPIEVMVVLQAISRAFEPLRDEVDRWVLSRHMRLEQRVRFFSDVVHPLAAPYIGGWLDELVTQAERKFREATTRDPVQFPGDDPGHALSAAAKVYTFREGQVVGWAARLIRASANPELYVEQKASLFEGVATIPCRGQGAIADVMRDRLVVAERSRTFGHSPPESFAQLKLLKLRISCGSEVGVHERAFLRDAFLDSDHRVRAVAADVAGLWITTVGAEETLSLLVMRLLTDPSLLARAVGAEVAIRAGIVYDGSVGDSAFRRVAALSGGDAPYVVQTVYYAFADNRAVLPESRIQDVGALAELGVGSSHAGIRRAASALMKRLK